MIRITCWGRLLLGCALLAGAPAGAQEGGGDMVTYDEELARVAEEIPGFGGLWVDEKGRTHVYLADLSYGDEAQRLGGEDGVEVHKGDYDVRDLAAWKEELRPLLAEPGTVFLDLDEQSNRLRLRVQTGVEQELERALRGSRVPREAVILEVGDPFRPLELLTDRIRPVPGGVRISSLSNVCSVGVNAIRAGVRGFVTNSHCSNSMGTVDGTVFFQRSSFAAGDKVGAEIADPGFFTGGSCPSGKLCRYSDASFVDYDFDTQSGGLKIANPVLCGIGFAGPLTVNPGLPRLPITGFLFSSPKSGTLVAKIGASTGCTIGAVQATCADTNFSVGSNITLLCQNHVGGINQVGDSGAPVFLHHGDAATLTGVLWGGSSSTFVYSPWLFVHGELGGLTLVP